MRTHNELIQVCLDNFDEYFISGLCYMFKLMYLRDVISNKEMFYLQDMSLKARPDDFHPKGNHWPYYWKPRDKEPRIEWLKSQLEPEMVTVKDQITGVAITIMPVPWFDEPEPKEPELEYPQ